MGGFDFYRDLADEATDEVFGETARVEPRVASQYAGAQADPDRDAFEVNGIYAVAPENVRIQGQRGGEGINSFSRIAAQNPEFWISAAEYAATFEEIRKDDLLIVAAGRFNIAEVRPQDTGDVLLLLTREPV